MSMPECNTCLPVFCTFSYLVFTCLYLVYGTCLYLLFSVGVDTECSGEADVVFVLDVSRYNARRDVRNVKRFARDIIKQMAFKGGNFRVGVVEFGAVARTRLTLAEGDDKKTVKSVLSGIRFANMFFCLWE